MLEIELRQKWALCRQKITRADYEESISQAGYIEAWLSVVDEKTRPELYLAMVERLKAEYEYQENLFVELGVIKDFLHRCRPAYNQENGNEELPF